MAPGTGRGHQPSHPYLCCWGNRGTGRLSLWFGSSACPLHTGAVPVGTQSKAQQGHRGMHAGIHTHPRTLMCTLTHTHTDPLLSVPEGGCRPCLPACREQGVGNLCQPPSTSPGSGSPACLHLPLPSPGPPQGGQQTQKRGLQHPKEGSWGSRHRNDAPQLGDTGFCVKWGA